MRKNFCESKDNSFVGCKYYRKVYNTATGRFLHHGCYFLPYWGKNIEDIKKCPRFNANGTENEWTLRSVCKVNN